MNTINKKLYDILRTDFKLTETKAKEFTEVIQDIVAKQSKDEAVSYKSELREDLTKLEMRLELKIEQTKSELLKWFIGMFVTLALMIIGLYIKKG